MNIPEMPVLPPAKAQEIVVEIQLTPIEWQLNRLLKAHYLVHQSALSLAIIILLLLGLFSLGIVIHQYTNDMFFATVIVFILGLLCRFSYKKWHNIDNKRLINYKKTPFFASCQGLKRYRVTLTEAGVAYQASSGGQFILPWQHIDYMESSDQILCIYGANQLIYIPVRHFQNAQQHAQFMQYIEKFSEVPCHHKPNLWVDPVSYSVFSLKTLIADSADNLRAGLLLSLWQVRGLLYLKISSFQVIVLSIIYLILRILLDLSEEGWQSEFNPIAFGVYAIDLLTMLMFAWLISLLVQQRLSILMAMVSMQAIYNPVILFQILLNMLVPLHESIAPMVEFLHFILLMNVVFASLFALVWQYGLPKWGYAWLMGLMFMVALPGGLFQIWIGEYYLKFWRETYVEEEGESNYYFRLKQISAENVLYQQPEILSRALNKIAHGDENRAELYFVGFAGYSSQDVFMREVKSVSALINKRFDSAPRSVALINNPNTVTTHPFATLTALERTFKVMGERMNLEDDVLFLFMTSHGSENPPELSTELWPFHLNAITPQSLRAALDKSGIKNRVIVVSSCYSGGFIQPLADENTLIISASLPDRSSYGCSHENDWTFFGQAYFHEALRQTFSFEEAFKMAEKNIAEREKAAGYKPSKPQIAMGKNIIERLKVIENHLKTQQRPIEK